MSFCCEAFLILGNRNYPWQLKFSWKGGGIGVLMGIQRMRDKEWPCGYSCLFWGLTHSSSVWFWLTDHLLGCQQSDSPFSFQYFPTSQLLLTLGFGSFATLSPTWHFLSVVAHTSPECTSVQGLLSLFVGLHSFYPHAQERASGPRCPC